MQDTHSSSVTPIDLRHERCLTLLPWWINGTLVGAERALVESHLRGCSACQREDAQLRVLAAHVRADGADSRCEDALRRLHAKLEQPLARRTAQPWAAAAVLVLICGLSGLSARHAETNMAWLRNMGLNRMHQSVVMSGDTQATTARLVFYNDITEGQLRALLLSVGAELIEGPTERGVYTVALGRGRSQAQKAEALAQLRHSGQVVYAEAALNNTVSNLGSW